MAQAVFPHNAFKIIFFVNENIGIFYRLSTNAPIVPPNIPFVLNILSDMENHEKIGDDLYKVTYSDGTVITVDYIGCRYTVQKDGVSRTVKF